MTLMFCDNNQNDTYTFASDLIFSISVTCESTGNIHKNIGIIWTNIKLDLIFYFNRNENRDSGGSSLGLSPMHYSYPGNTDAMQPWPSSTGSSVFMQDLGKTIWSYNDINSYVIRKVRHKVNILVKCHTWSIELNILPYFSEKNTDLLFLYVIYQFL